MIEFIVDECDKAAPELPVSYKDFYNETGRATRGMAMSVKARALLYAASKLHNPSHATDKWEKAAKAAYDIKQGGTPCPTLMSTLCMMSMEET